MSIYCVLWGLFMVNVHYLLFNYSYYNEIIFIRIENSSISLQKSKGKEKKNPTKQPQKNKAENINYSMKGATRSIFLKH